MKLILLIVLLGLLLALSYSLEANSTSEETNIDGTSTIDITPTPVAVTSTDADSTDVGIDTRNSDSSGDRALKISTSGFYSQHSKLLLQALLSKLTSTSSQTSLKLLQHVSGANLYFAENVNSATHSDISFIYINLKVLFKSNTRILRNKNATNIMRINISNKFTNFIFWYIVIIFFVLK